MCSFTSSRLINSRIDGPKLVKTQVAEGIYVSLPQDFVPMTDDDIALKYLPFRKPVAMYTNPERVVDFGFNISNSKWRDSDLEIAKGFYKGSIAGMYSKVTFVQDGTIQKINKRDFAVFEFVSEVIDDDPNSMHKGSVTKQYSYIQYTLKGGKALVFNFTCPVKLKERWQTTAKSIMQSVKVK